MPRLTPEQQLEKAKQDKARAEVQIRAASAKLRATDRKLDARRKILLGAAFIAKARQNQNFHRAMLALIAEMPSRDRALFDEPEKQERANDGK